MSPAAVIAAAAAAGASNGVTTPSSSKPPLRRNQTATPGTPSSSHPRSNHPRGQLHVKVLQARGLNVASNQSRPYVVVQFEQSEFVSREPIASEMEKEVKGKAGPLSRTSSALALPSLAGAANASMMAGGGISRAFDKAAKATTAGAPPTTGSKLSGIPSLFGVMSPHNPVWKHEVSFDVTSDEALVYLNIYDRTPECDEFIGALEFKPVLVHDHTVDRWYSLQARENEVVTGEIRLQMTYEHIKSRRALTPKDFDFLKLIGRGTFGKVFQVRKKDTRRIYAMKVLSKKEIIAKKEVAHTIGERKILQRSLECPFLVGLKFSFQTERDLYLVTDFKSGGELFYHLQRETKFTEDRARFYIAELVLALEHLHKYDIMYRDLKPENILLDATGHVALCDFGLSKPDLGNGQLTNTFCGTTEYLAPEVLLDDQGYSKTVDFWSLGVLLFEMCCGWSPFYAEDVQQMYKNICFGRIKFPRGVIGEDGKQFVKGLLNRNPKNRLGAQRDTAELKEHPFFKSIDWVALGKKQVTPPFKPQVTSDESTENFDVEFTNADLRDTGIDIFDSDDEGDDDDGWAVNTVATDGLSTSGTTISSENGSPVGSINSSSPGKAANATASNHKHGMRGGIPETPISSSIQDHFRGFTFQGESTLDEAMRLVGEEDVFAHEGEDYGEAGGDDEDEWEDEEPVGRYQGKKQEVGYFD
ncbi:Pkinase-domain-containing protein [Clavulina sp. PMI_390]|nr:Pkinase-domain-containing protein [Clavulina sp. PMI_390]